MVFGFVPIDMLTLMQVRWKGDAVKGDESTAGKKGSLCLSLILEALGLALDLDISRQPKVDWKDSGEVGDR